MAWLAVQTTTEVKAMINNPTIDKLIEMRLTAMADAYLQQLSDPTMKEADFDDRLGMIIDIEYTRRKNNR